MRISTPHPRGAGRFGCLVFLVGCVLLYGGGQGLYTGLTNTSPTEMTLKEYETQRPKALWLKLTKATGFIAEATFEEKFGKLTQLYIPLYAPLPADELNEDSLAEALKCHVILATKNPKYLEVMSSFKKMSPEEQQAYEIEHEQELLISGAFTGLVRFGIEQKGKDYDQLAKLNPNLVKDFVILDEGKQPELGFSALMFAIGLAIVAFSLRALFKSDPPKGEDGANALKTAAEPAAPQDQAPNPPDAPAPGA